MGLLHKEGKPDAAAAAQAESRHARRAGGELAAEATAVAAEVRDLLLRIPNTPHPDAPDGAGEAENPVVRVVGFDPDGYGEHQRIPHWELGPRYGILDNERAVKISGAMFTMQRKGGATLARALLQYALDRNADEFEEVRPPTLVTSETLTATGQLPKFADDAYSIERDDLWCIPTAEVPLTSIHRDEIIDAAELPLRFMAATSCFRREAGRPAATPGHAPHPRVRQGRGVRIRHARAGARRARRAGGASRGRHPRPGLAYRVIEICTGDMGQSHHRSFDIEVYAPGHRPVARGSSVSWFSDYQSRRGNIRYRPGRRGTAMVHTLNGSALAVPRVWAAIVETYHRADGGIDVPEALLPYFRGSDRIA